MKMFILVLKSKLNLEPEDCVLFSANKIVYVHFKTYHTMGIPFNSHLRKVMVLHKLNICTKKEVSQNYTWIEFREILLYFTVSCSIIPLEINTEPRSRIQ